MQYITLNSVKIGSHNYGTKCCNLVHFPFKQLAKKAGLGELVMNVCSTDTSGPIRAHMGTHGPIWYTFGAHSGAALGMCRAHFGPFGFTQHAKQHGGLASDAEAARTRGHAWAKANAVEQTLIVMLGRCETNEKVPSIYIYMHTCNRNIDCDTWPLLEK